MSAIWETVKSFITDGFGGFIAAAVAGAGAMKAIRSGSADKQAINIDSATSDIIQRLRDEISRLTDRLENMQLKQDVMQEKLLSLQRENMELREAVRRCEETHAFNQTILKP